MDPRGTPLDSDLHMDIDKIKTPIQMHTINQNKEVSSDYCL